MTTLRFVVELDVDTERWRSPQWGVGQVPTEISRDLTREIRRWAHREEGILVGSVEALDTTQPPADAPTVTEVPADPLEALSVKLEAVVRWLDANAPDWQIGCRVETCIAHMKGRL